MTDIGLWAIAATDPGRTAVIDPGGAAVSYAGLAARADRYGRGLQALGLRPGDCVAGMLPNSTEALALFFAAIQTGLYVVPVNWHLTAAEVAYILADSEARAFVAHERFGEVAAEAAAGAGIDPRARFAVGTVPGFMPLDTLGAGGDGRPGPRTAGAPMVYTSGTSGRPKGVRRPLTGEDPDQPPMASTWFFGIFSLAPGDGNVHLCCSPLYHTAVLNFATISLQLGHPVVLMDRFDAAELLALVQRHRVTHTHMVPTQFRRLLALPEETRKRYDVSSMRAAIHSAAPCPPDVKRQMIDWWGPVITEYYAASEGGGTVITRAEWLRPARLGRPALAGFRGARARRRGQRRARRPARAGVHAHGHLDLRLPQGRGEDARLPRPRHVHRGRHRLPRRGRLPLPLRPQERHDHLGRREHLPGRDRGRAAPATRPSTTWPCSASRTTEWGEEIKAVVQPAPGAEPGPELTADLLAFLDGRLARFKLPRSIDYVPELPRDPNGKLYKRRLRDPYWADRHRSI